MCVYTRMCVCVCVYVESSDVFNLNHFRFIRLSTQKQVFLNVKQKQSLNNQLKYLVTMATHLSFRTREK